jgi:hypothetical protein
MEKGKSFSLQIRSKTKMSILATSIQCNTEEVLEQLDKKGNKGYQSWKVRNKTIIICT